MKSWSKSIKATSAIKKIRTAQEDAVIVSFFSGPSSVSFGSVTSLIDLIAIFGKKIIRIRVGWHG